MRADGTDRRVTAGSSERVIVESPEAADVGDEAPIDLLRYLRILERRKWTILVFLVVVVAGGTAWTLRQTPIYQATATVQVDLKAPTVLGSDIEQVEELGTGSYWNNQEYIGTQVKIIQSREVAKRVVKNLNLDRDPDFAVTKEGEERSISEIADVLRKRISAAPIRDTRLLEISVEGPDPERARDIANAAADVYLEQNVERMLSATVSAVDWLNRQAGDLQDQLEESERALYEFRKNHDILSVSLEERQNIITSQIQQLSDAATAARTRRIELAAKVAEMRSMSKMDPLEMPVGRLMDNEVIQDLKRQHSTLSKQRDGLSKRYGSNWPQIREIEAEREDIRETIGREVRAVLESMEGELRSAERTEQGIRAALEKAHQEALALNVHEVEHNRLARAQKSSAKMYGLVQGRSTETDLSRLLRVNNLRVLDAAVTPRAPIKPRVSINIALAVILGLLGGIGLALLLEMLDVTVKRQADLEALGVAFLGMLPSIEPAIERREKRRKKKANGRSTTGMRKDLFVHEHPKSTVSESARSIRTNLLFMTAERSLRTLVVTSPGPREGKTTVATTLAIVMAQSGSRTVIVDTDMRRPRVHQAFGVENEVGISSVIVGQATLDEAAQETDVPNLWVIPSGPVPPNPAELLLTARFGETLSELLDRFDRVIFDSPPMGAVTDAAILATQVDGVVLVAKAGQTRKEGARQSLGQLREIGARVLGTVLNDVDLSRREYGYYHYYRGKGKGYYYQGYGSDRESDFSQPEARP